MLNEHLDRHSKVMLDAVAVVFPVSYGMDWLQGNMAFIGSTLSAIYLSLCIYSWFKANWKRK